jgi:hypothetical protein
MYFLKNDSLSFRATSEAMLSRSETTRFAAATMGDGPEMALSRVQAVRSLRKSMSVGQETMVRAPGAIVSVPAP